MDHSDAFPLRRTDLWLSDKDSKSTKVFSDAKLALDEYDLNESGSVIWELCTGQNSVKDIVDYLLSQTEGTVPSEAQVGKETIDFLQELAEKRLVEIVHRRYTDVLLVAPPYPSSYSPEVLKTPEFSAPPLGICYLASVLRTNGVNVRIVDMHQEAKSPEDIIQVCKSYRPQVVGITATTPTFPLAVKISKYIKAWDESTTTVIGGAHATCDPEECLSFHSLDFVCVGEGENTLLELVQNLLAGAKTASSIPGLAYRNGDGTVSYTEKREWVVNLDEIPLPARDSIDMGSYLKRGSIVSSRGCPYGCNFCSCSVIVGRGYRTRSVANVLDEIESLIKDYSCDSIDFHDDIFNLDSNRVLDFCRSIERRNLEFAWGCFCRADQFTEKLASEMASAGCRVVQFGVESGSQRVMDAINKHLSLRQVEDAVEAAKKAGIPQIVCGFIIGHAQDTEESVRETIKFGEQVASIGATRVTLSLLTPFPGTDVFDNREMLGIRLISENWEDFTFSRVVMETDNLNAERLRELYTEGIIRFLEASIS